MKKASLILTLFGMIVLIGMHPQKTYAWCTPRILHCGDVIDSCTSVGYDDNARYSCTGTTNWNGKAHVYKITTTGDSLWLRLDWTGDAYHAIAMFVLSDCNQNHCVAWDPHALNLLPTAGDWWIIIDSRYDYGTCYTLHVYCGDFMLPVELQSFTGTDATDGVHLAWSTASETNNRRFYLERQLQDTDEWTRIAAVNGQGQSSSLTNYSYVDQFVEAGMAYAYHLLSEDMSGNVRELQLIRVEHDVASGAQPLEYALMQNYPNPFNPTTSISYTLKEASHVKMTVFDPMGRTVATLVDGNRTAGRYTVSFDGSTLSTGIYFYRLEAGSFTAVRKLVLIK
jgi:hypothetical protein